jgi:hypothetical protein
LGCGCISRFEAFILIPNSGYEEDFKIRKTIGFMPDPDKNLPAPTDYWLAYSGGDPNVLWGIPSSELVQKISDWIASKAVVMNNKGEKFTLYSERLGSEFRVAFGNDVTQIAYEKSHVLKNMLDLAPCGFHFLKPKGAALKQVTEKVAIEKTDSGARITTTGYLYEYLNSPPIEITAKQAEQMARADFENLLYIGSEKNSTDKYRANLARAKIANEKALKDIDDWKHQQRDIKFRAEWLWFYGGPVIGLAGLVTLYLRKRRNGR